MEGSASKPIAKSALARRSETMKAHAVVKASASPVPASRSKRSRAKSPEDFKTSLLAIRVKDELKADATKTLAEIGISLPEAVRVFLGRIVSEKVFPFPLEIPNAETKAALAESRTTTHRRFSNVEELFDDIEKGSIR